MRKTILLFLIMLLYFIVCNFCMAQEKNSKNRELTIYMRVKDHLTHDDIDSTLTARLLLAKDSSFVDSAKIAKTNYQGQRFTYAQAVLKDAGKYLMEINKGGEITVNGQRVESMLLNGKDFMNSDRELLLENMPAYMVKKIKSYERIPLTARGTNREKEVQKELVMDIDLKRDYHTGWMANADGGAGSALHSAEDKRDTKFVGRLFGLRFSDKSRLMLYGNTNNVNDDHTPGDNGDWSSLKQTEGQKD